VKLDDLWIALGFKIDAKNLEKFEGLAEKSKKTMLGLGAAVAGAVGGIGLMVEKAAGDMGDVQNFAEQMGISAREVAALGKVAAENDSSLEAMKSGLRSLTVMTGQAAAGVGRGAMFFKKYHIAAKNADGSTKDVNEVLGDVIDKMAGMDRVKRIALGQRLGFDDATIYLMGQGRENFEKLRLAALKSNPLTNENYELADKTDKLFRKASSSVGLLNKRIAVALMPTVNKVLERFIRWTKEDGNVRRLTDALQTVVNVLEILWKNLDKVAYIVGVMAAYKLGARLIEWSGNAMAAAKSLGTLASAGGLLRTLLTGGLIAAIFLVAEDLWTFYQGGESVTGLLLQKFPYAVEVVKGVLVALGASLVALSTGSGPLGLLVLGIGGLVIAAQSIRDAWNPLKQWWQELWDDMFNSVARFWNSIPQPIRRVIGGMAIGDFSGEEMSLDVLKNAERSRLKLAQFGGEGFKPWGSEETGEPSWMTKRSPSGGVTTTTNITGVNINLPNVTDPRQAAREVNRGLARIAHGGVGG